LKPPTVCPVCGEDVSPNAKACRGCGADERSGWNEDALMYDGLDLPDEAWEDEVSDDRPERPPGEIALHWRIAAALALAALVIWFLGGLF
jgi:hypothetical protein